jgi:transposase-like protein
LRLKPRFTTEFKEAAVKRLKMASTSEVARACGISLSVLHRWRKQFGHYKAKSPSTSRRRFTKQFKKAAVERLEKGGSLIEVASSIKIPAAVLSRWRQEWRQFGAEAFSGYGKSRLPSQPTRVVRVFLTQDEDTRIKVACTTGKARSLTLFARSLLLESAAEISLIELLARLDSLVVTVQSLMAAFD